MISVSSTGISWLDGMAAAILDRCYVVLSHQNIYSSLFLQFCILYNSRQSEGVDRHGEREGERERERKEDAS